MTQELRVLQEADTIAERMQLNPQDAGDVTTRDRAVVEQAMGGQSSTQYGLTWNTAVVRSFFAEPGVVVSGSGIPAVEIEIGGGFGGIYVTATTSVTTLEEQITELQIQTTSLEQEVKALTQGVKMLDRRLCEVIDGIRERPIVTPAHLLDLGSADFYLPSPIPIVIEEYEQEVVARVPELELHGSGDTEPEAVADLKSSFIELYLDLESTAAENMGKLPARWWTLLTKLVEKRGQA